MDKTNAADLSGGVFAILISVIGTKKNTKSIVVSQISLKNGKQWYNKGSTELYSLNTAADNIVYVISFIGRIVLWSENKFFPKSGSSQVWL